MLVFCVCFVLWARECERKEKKLVRRHWINDNNKCKLDEAVFSGEGLPLPLALLFIIHRQGDGVRVTSGNYPLLQMTAPLSLLRFRVSNCTGLYWTKEIIRAYASWRMARSGKPIRFYLQNCIQMSALIKINYFWLHSAIRDNADRKKLPHDRANWASK